MYKLPCPDNVLYLGSVGKAGTSHGVEEEEAEEGGKKWRVLTNKRREDKRDDVGVTRRLFL